MVDDAAIKAKAERRIVGDRSDTITLEDVKGMAKIGYVGTLAGIAFDKNQHEEIRVEAGKKAYAIWSERKPMFAIRLIQELSRGNNADRLIAGKISMSPSKPFTADQALDLATRRFLQGPGKALVREAKKQRGKPTS